MTCWFGSAQPSRHQHAMVRLHAHSVVLPAHDAHPSARVGDSACRSDRTTVRLCHRMLTQLRIRARALSDADASERSCAVTSAR